MKTTGAHIPDEQLLLYTAAELKETGPQTVAKHLESCALCAMRLSELSGALTDFSEAHRETLNGTASLRPGARLRLDARLAETAARDLGAWRRSLWRHGFVFATLALVVVLAATWNWSGAGNDRNAGSVAFAEPNARLTPGAALATSATQLCSDSHEGAPTIPAALRARVLQMYGVASTQAGAYEVDYLITPELGGATDIRNLWPEPYHDTVWNAHVKDQLEARLHQMVCHGEVDLTTAQHAISTDWIAAYRKYFHADLPVSDRVSSGVEPPLRHPLG